MCEDEAQEFLHVFHFTLFEGTRPRQMTPLYGHRHHVGYLRHWWGCETQQAQPHVAAVACEAWKEILTFRKGQFPVSRCERKSPKSSARIREMKVSIALPLWLLLLCGSDNVMSHVGVVSTQSGHGNGQVFEEHQVAETAEDRSSCTVPHSCSQTMKRFYESRVWIHRDTWNQEETHYAADTIPCILYTFCGCKRKEPLSYLHSFDQPPKSVQNDQQLSLCRKLC